MPLFAETEDKIFGDIMFNLVENTNTTRTSPGSKTRAIAQAVSKKMGRMWSQFDLNMIQAYVDGAEGKFLEFIGNMLGVPRLGERPASISSVDRVVRFYVEVGTFGDINGGTSIRLPAGTLVSTVTAGQGIKYLLPFSVILPSDVDEFFVTAESVRPGSASHTGKNTLVFHNFNDYTDSINNSLKVTNSTEINVGQDIESDTNYRFRIVNQIVAAEKANETAIRLAALVVPGVADVTLIPFDKGIGTYSLLIKSTTPSVPSGLLDAVRENVGRSTSQGILPFVSGPKEIGMSMIGTLTLRRIISTQDESSIISAATENVINYINNLDIGEDFIVNEVVERVLSTSDTIKNIGSANRPLDKVFIYRPSRLEDNKTRSTLTGDFAPESDEKLLVESVRGGTTPILFRISV